jgi:sugar phosphate isomerase/epimerase
VKLGVLTVLYQKMPFEEALNKLKVMGAEAVEIGTGNYPGNAHCDLDRILGDGQQARNFGKAVESRGLFISALSQHGNPLHPDEAIAAKAHDTWRKTVQLASQLEVPVVNAFSGCPGDSEGSKYPNWVTCPWPEDFLAVLEWQWDEKVIPYWEKEAAYAKEHGISIGFEMHPGFVVYNPETLLRLREACGDAIGANLDPSHLFWQGMDVIEAIKTLGGAGAIFHAHAKDTQIDKRNVALAGVLDTKPYTDLLHRSWVFRTTGYGQGLQVWRDIVSTLRAVNYDYVLSIEHEDAYMSIDEGLQKGIHALRTILFKEPATEAWWT